MNLPDKQLIDIVINAKYATRLLASEKRPNDSAPIFSTINGDIQALMKNVQKNDIILALKFSINVDLFNCLQPCTIGPKKKIL